MKYRSRSLTAGLVILAAVCLSIFSGCYQTPQQRLVGRWFNAEMSIRFNADGSLVYNAVSGKSRGIYHFTPSLQSAGATANEPNLIVDVATAGGRVRYQFEAVFLAHDRLRLHDLTPRASVSVNESIHQFALLRRASEPAGRASAGR